MKLIMQSNSHRIFFSCRIGTTDTLEMKGTCLSHPGDVLLFSGEKGSYISEAIMFLTNAPVSHAAIAYNPSSSVVEETPPAVQTNPAAKRFDGRKITVMRLDPPQPDYETRTGRG